MAMTLTDNTVNLDKEAMDNLNDLKERFSRTRILCGQEEKPRKMYNNLFDTIRDDTCSEVRHYPEALYE